MQKNLNLKEYWKKELDRNAHKKRQNQTIFKPKHREATACWQESIREKEKGINPYRAKSNDCRWFTHVQTKSWENNEEC